MSRFFPRAALVACTTGLVLSAPPNVLAHGFAGARFFPATLATDDPFVADELSLPTVSSFRDDSGTRTDIVSVDFAKRVTRDLGVELGASYLRVHPPGGPSTDGFDNLEFGLKYQLDVDPDHEVIWAVGLDFDLGGTGAKRIGAEDFTTFTPAIFFGKGFGDLQQTAGWLRAFAVTGSLGIGLPERGAEPKVFKLGFAVEYSLPYLQSQVRNVGLGAPFDRMIPIVELALEKPLDHGNGKVTGTINPGLLWAGQYVQLGAEAIVPLNRASGGSVGFVAQLHVFVDDLFPATLGRPLFGG